MQFTIGAYQVQVAITDKEPRDRNGRPGWGIYRNQFKVIELWRGIPKDHREVVFYHELRHAWRYILPCDIIDEEQDAEHFAQTNYALQRELRRQGGITALHRLFEPPRRRRNKGGWKQWQIALWKECCNVASIGKVEQEEILKLTGKMKDDGEWSSTCHRLDDNDFAMCMSEVEKSPWFNGQILLNRSLEGVMTYPRWKFTEMARGVIATVA